MQFCLPTATEKKMRLPGDEEIEVPSIVTTHGVTIHGVPSQVWPWLIQMGQGRGGFYSYAKLENLIGCKMENANRIHEEWQQLEVGQSISIHPKAKRLDVVDMEHESHLVLMQSQPVRWSWSFSINEISSVRCRLLVRTRVNGQRRFWAIFVFPFVRMGHYVMERKMLTGIKDRVESSR